MSKKMKKLAFVSASFGTHEDAKLKIKYQTLLQDYEELQKEVKEVNNNLEAAKQKKVILSAEVSFLRQRYKYLLKHKPFHPRQERELMQPPKLEAACKRSLKTPIQGKEEVTFRDMHSSLNNSIKKSRVGKEAARRRTAPLFDLNHMEASHGTGRSTGTEYPTQTPFSCINSMGRNESAARNFCSTPVFGLTQNVPRHGGNNATPRIADLTLDLNQKERAQGENGVPSLHRAPFFDLNEVSGEEEDIQNGFEPMALQEPIKGLIRGGHADEQLNDLKLPICRNPGDGSTRIGKRKISWQDPVALRV